MIARLSNVDWDSIDANRLQQKVINLKPEELGNRLTRFFRNDCNLIIGDPKTLHLDPTKKFDPTAFIGEGWTVWKGPATGNGFEGREDLDTRSLALTEVDLSAALFENSLEGKETDINGEEKLRRLVADGNIRFGGNVFLALWDQQNKENSCLEWLRRNRKITWMSFFGLILRSPCGNRYVLSLCWIVGRWRWRHRWLGSDWFAESLSAGARK